MAFSDKHTVAGALGTIIGYLGAGAADATIFERLMWPQRYYQHVSLLGLVKIALSMPMGGPIHKVALDVLDVFRTKGLYGGVHKGHMLGTSFYADTGLTPDCKVRNGIWVDVMRRLCRYPAQKSTSARQDDAETSDLAIEPTRRTLQRIQLLELSQATPSGGTDRSRPMVAEVSEDHAAGAALLGIFVSELSALICASVLMVISRKRDYWFAMYLCFPLLLKLSAFIFSVRREPTGSNRPGGQDSILVQVDDYDHGFSLISGPEHVVRQFFRHWGHPRRSEHADRFRELLTICIVWIFVIYFPVGLLSMLWSNHSLQLIWVAYQIFIVLSMHISRIFGLNNAGQLQEGLAYHLATAGVVRLQSEGGGTIEARLVFSMDAFGIPECEKEVGLIARQHLDSIQVDESEISDSLTVGNATTAPSIRTSDGTIATDIGFTIEADGDPYLDS